MGQVVKLDTDAQYDDYNFSNSLPDASQYILQ